MRFIADVMLGRLARWLRALGFDTKRPTDSRDSELFRCCLAENRVLLTRDRELWRQAGQGRALLIRSTALMEQLSQVLNELNLRIERARLFSRCLKCNAEIEHLSSEQVRGKVPAYVFETHRTFHRCPVCDQIFWPGTHWQRVLASLERGGFLPQVEKQHRAWYRKMCLEEDVLRNGSNRGTSNERENH